MIEAQLVTNEGSSTNGNANANVRDRVRGFVTTNFYVPDPAALKDEASLLDSGVIDSTGVLEVISFLESEFNISVADEEMVPENLDSISRIEAYVRRKTA